MASSTFPHVRGSRRGYAVAEVEDFLEDARRAYQGDPGAAGLVTATTIRQVAFSMSRGGYQPAAVDAALERLEEAFAARERERAIGQAGDQAWYSRTRDVAQELLDRVTRPRGSRFRRVGPFTGGYSVRDVDAFTDRVTTYLQRGTPLTAAEVRSAVFRRQRGGYSETQVDVVLDAVVDVLLAVRS